MIQRVVWMIITAGVATILYYVSRFWGFQFWGGDGLLGFESLRPQGGLVARWLRGTDFAPFELLIWVIGAFLLLTVLQKVFDLTGPKND